MVPFTLGYHDPLYDADIPGEPQGVAPPPETVAVENPVPWIAVAAAALLAWVIAS
jgi:hypothetical protein